MGLDNWTTEPETYKGFTVKSKIGAWGGIQQTVNLKAGDIVTFSLYAKTDSDDSQFFIYATQDFETNINPYRHEVIVAKEWQRISRTFYILQDTEVMFRLEKNNDNGKLYICAPKLESGENRNPIWTPNSNEMIFTKSELKTYLDEYMENK